MGGHGGLNILPQKRWNVYNFDNREKVRKDEEEAAKAEQLKREQSRKRDTEFRIQQLRQARGLPAPSPSSPAPSTEPVAAEPKPSDTEPKSKHINLFEGIKFMDPVEVVDDKRKAFKRMKKEEDKSKQKPKPKADVLPEDEKYRLGYGVCGKGVKVPWYMEKRLDGDGNGGEEGGEETGSGTGTGRKSVRKKSVEELREERLKREGREKERERALLKQKGRGGVSVQSDGRYSRRR